MLLKTEVNVVNLAREEVKHIYIKGLKRAKQRREQVSDTRRFDNPLASH